jgi:hypothetical protein
MVEKLYQIADGGEWQHLHAVLPFNPPDLNILRVLREHQGAAGR